MNDADSIDELLARASIGATHTIELRPTGFTVVADIQ